MYWYTYYCMSRYICPLLRRYLLWLKLHVSVIRVFGEVGLRTSLTPRLHGNTFKIAEISYLHIHVTSIDLEADN